MTPQTWLRIYGAQICHFIRQVEALVDPGRDYPLEIGVTPDEMSAYRKQAMRAFRTFGDTASEAGDLEVVGFQKTYNLPFAVAVGKFRKYVARGGAALN